MNTLIPSAKHRTPLRIVHHPYNFCNWMCSNYPQIKIQYNNYVASQAMTLTNESLLIRKMDNKHGQSTNFVEANEREPRRKLGHKLV